MNIRLPAAALAAALLFAGGVQPAFAQTYTVTGMTATTITMDIADPDATGEQGMVRWYATTTNTCVTPTPASQLDGSGDSVTVPAEYDGGPLTTNNLPQTGFQVTGLSGGMAYCFLIVLGDDTYWYSTTTPVQTAAPMPVLTIDSAAWNSDNTGIVIEWSWQNFDASEGYVLARCAGVDCDPFDADIGVRVATFEQGDADTPTSLLTYTDNAPRPGRVNRYRFHSLTSGAFANSNLATVQPATPPVLTIDSAVWNDDNTGIVISWSWQNFEPGEAYALARCVGAGCNPFDGVRVATFEQGDATTPTTLEMYTDAGATAGMVNRYQFHSLARRAFADSNVGEAQPPAPSDPTITPSHTFDDQHRTVLSWTTSGLGTPHSLRVLWIDADAGNREVSVLEVTGGDPANPDPAAAVTSTTDPMPIPAGESRTYRIRIDDTDSKNATIDYSVTGPDRFTITVVSKTHDSITITAGGRAGSQLGVPQILGYIREKPAGEECPAALNSQGDFHRQTAEAEGYQLFTRLINARPITDIVNWKIPSDTPDTGAISAPLAFSTEYCVLIGNASGSMQRRTIITVTTDDPPAGVTLSLTDGEGTSVDFEWTQTGNLLLAPITLLMRERSTAADCAPNSDGNIQSGQRAMVWNNAGIGIRPATVSGNIDMLMDGSSIAPGDYCGQIIGNNTASGAPKSAIVEVTITAPPVATINSAVWNDNNTGIDVEWSWDHFDASIPYVLARCAGENCTPSTSGARRFNPGDSRTPTTTEMYTDTAAVPGMVNRYRIQPRFSGVFANSDIFIVQPPAATVTLALATGAGQFTATATFTNPIHFPLPVNLWLRARDGAACPQPNADGNLPGALIAHQWTSAPSASETVTITHLGDSDSTFTRGTALTAGFYCALIFGGNAASGAPKSAIMQVEVTAAPTVTAIEIGTITAPAAGMDVLSIPYTLTPANAAATVRIIGDYSVAAGAPHDACTPADLVGGASISVAAVTTSPQTVDLATVVGDPDHPNDWRAALLAGGQICARAAVLDPDDPTGPALVLGDAFTINAASLGLTPDAPDAPGQPTATANAHNRVTVTWSAPDDNGAAIMSYTLTRTPPFPATVTVGASPRSYVDTTVTRGNSYTYTVTATNSVGDSPVSPASASVTTPNSGVVLTAEEGEGTADSPFTTVTLSWVNTDIMQSRWLGRQAGPVAHGAPCMPTESSPAVNPSNTGTTEEATTAAVTGLTRGMDYCFYIIVVRTTPSLMEFRSNTARVSIPAEPMLRLTNPREVNDASLDPHDARFAVDWTNAGGNDDGITDIDLRWAFDPTPAAACPSAGSIAATNSATVDFDDRDGSAGGRGYTLPAADAVAVTAANMGKLCITAAYNAEGSPLFTNVVPVTLTGRAAEGPRVASTQFQFRVGDATASPLAPVSIDNSPPSDVSPSTPATAAGNDGETVTVTLQGAAAGEGATGYTQAGVWAFDGGTVGAAAVDLPAAAATSTASITINGETVMIPGLGFNAAAGGNADTATFNAPVVTAMTAARQTINLSPIVLRFTYTVTQSLSGTELPAAARRTVYIRIRAEDNDTEAVDNAVLPAVLRNITHSINNSIFNRIQQRQRADGKWK